MRLGKTLIVGAVLVATSFAARPARGADDATVKLYQAKCGSCHGADGAGTTTAGKALKLKDIRTAEVQKTSDADLTTLINKGKNKMPAGEKTLKPVQVKALVGYVRELAKK